MCSTDLGGCEYGAGSVKCRQGAKVNKVRARGQGNTVSAANAAIGGGNTNRYEDNASNGEHKHCSNPYQWCRERHGLNEILACARHNKEFGIEFELEIWESQRLGGL